MNMTIAKIQKSGVEKTFIWRGSQIYQGHEPVT